MQTRNSTCLLVEPGTAITRIMAGKRNHSETESYMPVASSIQCTVMVNFAATVYLAGWRSNKEPTQVSEKLC